MSQEYFAEANFKRWKESLRNYEFLQDRVPGATDVDLFIHAAAKDGDRFLVCEFKAAGETVPMGQRIAFEALRNLGWTVLTVYGPDSKGLYVVADGKGKPAKMDKDGLATVIEAWWTAAKGAPKDGARRSGGGNRRAASA